MSFVSISINIPLAQTPMDDLKELEAFRIGRTRNYCIPENKRMWAYEIMSNNGWDLCVNDPDDPNEGDAYETCVTGNHSYPLEAFLTKSQRQEYVQKVQEARKTQNKPPIEDHLIVTFDEGCTYDTDEEDDENDGFIRLFFE